MERPQEIIRTVLQETNSEQDGEVTHQDGNNFRAAIYRERRKKYGRLPKTLHETLATLRSMPLSTHRKEDLMLCEEINGKCFGIFTTKINLRTLFWTFSAALGWSAWFVYRRYRPNVWHAWWCPVPSVCRLRRWQLRCHRQWLPADVVGACAWYNACHYQWSRILPWTYLNAEFNTPHSNIYVFVEVLLRQQAATYVTFSSLWKSRIIPRSTPEKSACLRELFTQYSTDYHTRLDYLQRVGYQFAPS